MKKKSDQSSNTSELRRQVEARPSKGRKKAKHPSVAQAENLHLIHELQIRQVELEIQNEQLVQSQRALKDSNDKFLSLVNNIPGNIAYVNANTLKYEFVNNVFARSFGIPQEKIVGSHIKEIIGENNYQVALKYIDIARSGKPVSYENTFNLASGKRWIEVNYAPIFDTHGNVVSIAVLSFDITERKQVEDALRENQEMFSLFIRHSPIYAFIKDVTPTESRVLLASDNFQEMIGISGRDMLGKTMIELFPPEFAAKITADDWSVVAKGMVLKVDEDLNGRNYTTIKFPITQGDKTLLAGYTIDITERVQAERALEVVNFALQTALIREKRLAHTDALTGVNNRRYLFELAEYEFNVATRYQQPLSVILFDIDHFKEVNDTFGHAAGDQMLQRVTQVACAELRSADVIGRYGGEEFVIMLPMTNAQQAYPLAERIRVGVAAIRVPTEKGDAAVTLSIGIVEMLHGLETESAEKMIRRADEAMYTAKQAGRNRTEIGE